MNSLDVIRLIEADGWAMVRVTGSHHHSRRPTRPGLVKRKRFSFRVARPMEGREIDFRRLTGEIDVETRSVSIG